MNAKKLSDILAHEPKFRLKQIKRALFFDLLDDWEKVTTLPLELRKKLKRDCPLNIDAHFLVSKDKQTVKACIELSDGLQVETVLMQHKGKTDRNSVCVSTQVGCALGCTFCATGTMGLKRNLEAMEIVEQVLFFARYLKEKKEKITNIVFMGMGEPFLNYDNVIEAVRILNGEEGFGFGARRISISTSGVIEGIEKLSKEKIEVNLAISLHAPNDEIREKIMPINRKYPLKKVLQAVDKYIAATNRKVMFEYVLLQNVNDSDECAAELAKIMQKPLYMVNLVPYNETGIYKASSTPRIKKFREILEKNKVAVTQRYRFGDDIKAACGQLVLKK
jgi:23S rRNA (adenine2503-C2)-methyltransferase